MRTTNLNTILAAAAKKNEGPKILTVDIETLPGLYALFSRKVPSGWVNEQSEIEPSRVACFAAKWMHSKKVEFYSEHHHSTEEMYAQLWRLLDEADIVASWNGDRFDLPIINGELALAGYGPPSPYQKVDLLTKGSRQFGFSSHKLDSVAQMYGIGEKVKHEGMPLWLACRDGDDQAWGRMRRYNRQDVLLTEGLLNEFGPWIRNFPHMGQWNGNPGCCYACGGTNLTDAGTVRTLTLSYPLKRCQDCGANNKVLRTGATRRAA